MRCILLLIPMLVYAVDCASPENTAEKAVCTEPGLRAMDQEIEHETALLKEKLSGENASILMDTRMPFIRQINDCSNQSEVSACLRKQLVERRDLLRRAHTDPAAMREAIAYSYYIDIGFLWKYWRQLAGRKVSDRKSVV